MPNGLIFSVAAHAALAGAVLLGLGGPKTFTERTEESMVVEVMTPDEVARETSRPEPVPEPENPKQSLLPDLSFRPALSVPDLQARAAASAPQPDAGAGAAQRQTTQQEAAEQEATESESAKSAKSEAVNSEAATSEAARAMAAARAAAARAATASAQAEQSAMPPPGGGLQPDAAAQASFDLASLARLYTLRLPPGFDAPAMSTARLDADDVGAFKQDLRRCWRQPAGVQPGSATRVVLRVAFRPDGALAGDPTLVEASASPEGPSVFKAAMDALASCQPHRALPAERYDEWKVLDVTFTPREMAGG